MVVSYLPQAVRSQSEFDFEIYPHGFSARIQIVLSKAQAKQHLHRCGWARVPSPREWLTCTLTDGRKRWTIKGSLWLSGRKPSNKRLPLAAKNRLWKTVLYALVVEETTAGYYIDLSGVRIWDIEKFTEIVLDLKPSEWNLSYFRKMERYLVLNPHEAHALAEALACAPSKGRGRSTRKQFLVKGVTIPTTIRTRAKATATLNVYQIERGATGVFKCEVSLVGQRNRWTEFHADDVAGLDEILIGLVDQHDLHPVSKPSRWEPLDPEDAVLDGDFDSNLRQLNVPAWMGKKPKPVSRFNPNTPHGPKLDDSIDPAGGYPSPTRIRTIRAGTTTSTTLSQPGPGAGGSTGDTHPSTTLPSGNPIQSGPLEPWYRREVWKFLAREIQTHRGFLTEVILDADQDPAPLLESLVHQGATVQIETWTSCGDHGWYSVNDLTLRHPAHHDPDVIAILVDPLILSTVAALVGREDDHWERFLPGPLYPPYWQLHWGTLPLHVRVLGRVLAATFEGLKAVVERTGVQVLFITVDARPDHARGKLLRSHRFRDSRVRSLLGDAGRYWCHQRYRVEQYGHDLLRVVVLKDGVHGRVGRILPIAGRRHRGGVLPVVDTIHQP